MCNENDAYPSLLQVAHQLKQLCNFLFIKRRRRLIENQYFTVHIHRTGNRNHLLNRNRAAFELLRRRCRYLQRL